MHTQEPAFFFLHMYSAVGSPLVRERAPGRVVPGKTEPACLLFVPFFNSCVPSSQKVAAILEQSPLIFYPVKWPRTRSWGCLLVAYPGFWWDRYSSALLG